ncbi:hypothetical protein [Moorena bouillonii]|nr:hypothetical protein [Moorena bouillonii]
MSEFLVIITVVEVDASFSQSLILWMDNEYNHVVTMPECYRSLP